MTNEELKDWFLDKYNSCYPTTHIYFPNYIFMIYDINYIRKKKLANILDKEVEYPTEVKGDCLFSLDFQYNIFNIDYDKIWSFIESNCTVDVINFMGEITKYCELNKFSPASRDIIYNQDNNMLTPSKTSFNEKWDKKRELKLYKL
jgi:hypothetical protein